MVACIRNAQDFELIGRILVAIDQEVVKNGGFLNTETKIKRAEFAPEFIDVDVSFRIESAGWREFMRSIPTTWSKNKPETGRPD
jgi:hypothetical protein